jgi:hypothetical protein
LDLQDLESLNRKTRWLHNQSLHQPGIGKGFAVSGKKGDREVTISPGYAIDADGKEVVLTKKRLEPVPPVASEDDGGPVHYDLTVSYPEDTRLEEIETRRGVCLPRGVVRLREEPLFCWVKLDRNGKPEDTTLGRDILTGMKIVLSRAEVLNCQLNKDLSIAQRRSARPPSQPYIRCASVKPTWNIWDLIESAPDSVAVPDKPIILPFGLTATINTEDAGFEASPLYSARIQGSRRFQKKVGEYVSIFVMDGLANIAEPQPNSFTIYVLLMAQLLYDEGGGGVINKNEDLPPDWDIVWMGID